MDKKLICVLLFILLIAGIGVLILRGDEDSWIKDSRGIWIEHGNPSKTPGYVKEQQDAINCSLRLYQQKKIEEMNFSSQCLGTCGDYAVDIVHIPRTDEDNQIENQCLDYLDGKVNHFIELNKDGNIVRIK